MINENLVTGKPGKPRTTEKFQMDEDNPLASIEVN
jgi:hypothetical protein